MIGASQLVIQRAVHGFSATTRGPLALIILFPIVLVIGFFAERFRRRSAVVLGAILLLAIAAMTVWGTGNAPIRYRLAYLLVGPTVAFIGTAMHWRRNSAR
jgi:hypothetical protein